MTEAAILHQEPEYVLSGPPRGQLPEAYAQLFHSLESVIRDADNADSMAAMIVEFNNRFVWKTYRLRAECHGKRLTYEIKNCFGAVLRGTMERADVKRGEYA